MDNQRQQAATKKGGQPIRGSVVKEVIREVKEDVVKTVAYVWQGSSNSFCVKELALPATMDQQQQQQQVSRDPLHLSQRNTVHRRRRGEQSIFADQVVDVESSFFQGSSGSTAGGERKRPP
ncbi:unnamed protein product [Sphagnum troendelagicum]|uniref:Uncharacterized protein n=1 Tax=Sphagnum jensenii TaxID=128206 RepID=A0ABP0WF42_9BRYO